MRVSPDWALLFDYVVPLEDDKQLKQISTTTMVLPLRIQSSSQRTITHI